MARPKFKKVLAILLVIFCLCWGLCLLWVDLPLEITPEKEKHLMVEQRRRAEYCKKGNTKDSSKIKEHFFAATDPAKLFGICTIGKAASTSIIYALGPLYNVSGPQLHQDRVREAISKSGNSIEFRLGSSKIEEMVRATSGLFMITFIRHPFTRLLSCYEQKYIFTPELLFVTELVKFANNKGRMLDENGIPSFRTFIEYVIQMLNSKQGNEYGRLHWLQSTTECLLCSINYDFVGRVETLREDAQYLARKFPQYEEVFLTLADTEHANTAIGDAIATKTKEYFSQLSKHHLEDLYKLYEDDFAMGGYEFPSEYFSIAAN